MGGVDRLSGHGARGKLGRSCDLGSSLSRTNALGDRAAIGHASAVGMVAFAVPGRCFRAGIGLGLWSGGSDKSEQGKEC